MDNTPNAAPAQASEATPNTNSNPAPENTAPEQPQNPTANIPTEQIEAFNKFVEANGGFDKAFGKMKQTISNPQPQPKEAPQQPTAPQATVSEPAPVLTQPVKTEEGFITPTEIAALQYNKMLSEEYPEIAEYVSKGEYIKEATALGVKVVDSQGNMNAKAIRQFLDLKKAAVPPKATSTPITTTPTVEYKTIDGDVGSKEQAQKIMEQGEGHPQYKQAVQFMRESIFGKPKESKK